MRSLHFPISTHTYTHFANLQLEHARRVACPAEVKETCVYFVIIFWLDAVLVVACGVFVVAHALSSWGAWVLWLRSVSSVVATRA